MLFVVALFATQVMQAQKGLEFTLNFTPGSSMLLNNNDFEEGDALNYAARFAYNAHASVGFNITDAFGIYTGFGLSSVGQNYTTANEDWAKSEQHTFTTDLNYLRIPVGFRFGGDFTEGVSAYVRFGGFVDMLSTAKGSYTFNNEAKILGVAVPGINPNPYASASEQLLYGAGETATYDYRSAKHYEGVSPTAVEDEKVFNDVVFGAALDLGSRFRISDEMGIIFALHLEGTVGSVEGEDAVHHFITDSANERAGTFSLMAGFNLGFQYTIGF